MRFTLLMNDKDKILIPINSLASDFSRSVVRSFSMLQLQAYLVVILIVLLTWYGKYSWKRRRLYRMASKFPGPSSFWAIREILSSLVSGRNNALNQNYILKQYGTPCRVWYGSLCVIFLENPEDLQVVLSSSKCLDKFDSYKLIGAKKSLLASGGSLWRAHRKLLDPSFKINVLHSFWLI